LFQKNDSTLDTLMIMSTTQNCLKFVFSEKKKNQADGLLLIAPWLLGMIKAIQIHVTSTRQIEHYFSEKESTIIVQSPIIDSLLILGKGIAYIEYTQS